MKTPEERAARAAYMRTWSAANTDKRRAYRQNARKAREADPRLAEKFREQRKLEARRRRANNPQLRLKEAIRSRVRVAIHNYRDGRRKAGSAIKDLGCTFVELQAHLENQFVEGMSWTNYGEWHIDHVKPLSLFDLSDRQQFLEACSYKNLQPLWAGDNREKSNKWVEDHPPT